MQEIQDRASNAANRVDVAVGFVAGSTATSVPNCILDAFRVTENLLLDISQSGQRDEFLRFLAAGHEALDHQGADWKPFVDDQIKLWHKTKLNQKTIEVAGGKLSAWTPEAVDVEALDDALRRLEFIVMLEAESHAASWAEQGVALERMQALALILAGITVIAATNTVVDTAAAFTSASFGASLILEQVHELVASA